jgi:phage-related protein
MEGVKRIVLWAGESKAAIRGFPESVRWTFGRAVFKAELGGYHENASPMKGQLRGIVEVEASDAGDTYRLYYTLKCPGHIFILYCHKKKSKHGIGIPKHEMDIIHQRFKAAMFECRQMFGGV